MIAGLLGARAASVFPGADDAYAGLVTEHALAGVSRGWGRLHCRGRRRLDHWPRQGAGAAHRPAADRHSHHLRRLGDDADPRRDGGWAQDDAAQPSRAAGDGDLRRRPDARPADGPLRDLRRQRHRPCGGGALRERPQSDHLADGGGRHPRLGPRLAAHRRVAARSSARGAMRSTAPGCAASAWALPAWLCITSSATCSAACSICRMPRRTRSCCRMRSPTMRRRRPRRWRASRLRSAPQTRRRGCSISSAGLAVRARWLRSACRRTASTAPPTRPWRRPIGIRAR